MDARDMQIDLSALGQIAGPQGGKAEPNEWANGGAIEMAGVTYSAYANLAGTTELLIENKVQLAIV